MEGKRDRARKAGIGGPKLGREGLHGSNQGGMGEREEGKEESQVGPLRYGQGWFSK